MTSTREPPAGAPTTTVWPRTDLVVTLGFGAAGAAAPAGALVSALLSVAPPGPVGSAVFAAVSVLVAAAGTRALAALMRRHARMAHPVRATLAIVATQVAAQVALGKAAAFRVGALSLVLYCAPALIAAAAAVARSRAASGWCAAAAVGLGAAACVLGPAQQHWSAQEWIAANHITSPVAQVIDVPGMRQLPYQYDQASRQLTAIYTQPLFGTDAWSAVETVTPGTADPCGPLTTADGDGLGTQTPGCTQIAPSLWLRSDDLGSYGYVMHKDGVTITLTGPVDDGLLSAIEAAQPATDADLWRRTALQPASPIGWLLR